MFEISEECYSCQKRHLKDVKKNWDVKCNYIPKELWDNGFYPVEDVIGVEKYNALNIIEKTKLQYKFNKLLWAKHKLGWSPYNAKREEYQDWQKSVLMCSAKSKACRFGRRMGLKALILLAPRAGNCSLQLREHIQKWC